MVQVPEGRTVSTQGQHYVQYKVGRADQRRSFKLLSGWFRQFLLDLASLKTLLACSICGVVKDSFSTKSESMKSASSFLPMSSALIRSVAMTGLAGTLKAKKYSSLSSKLELKGLVKPETVSSTRSTLHLSRLNISFQCIKELFQYIEL